MNAKTIIAAIIGFACAASLFFVGCVDTKKTPPTDPKPIVDGVQSDLRQNATALKDTTSQIKDDATKGQAATPPAAKQVLDPYWLHILFNAGRQDQIVESLQQKDSKLEEAKTQITSLQQDRSSIIKERDKALADKDSNFAKFLYTLSGLGAVGLAVGVFIFIMQGGKIGIAVGGSGAVLIVTGLLLAKSLPFVPWLIGGVIVIMLGALGYFVVVKTRELLAKHQENQKLDKALTQVVKSIEPVKQVMTTEGRRAAFGDGAIRGIIASYHDDETKQIIADKRSQLKDGEKAPSIPATPAIDWEDLGGNPRAVRAASFAPKVRLPSWPASQPDPDVWTVGSVG